MIGQYFKGFQYGVQGFTLLVEPKLRKFVLIPLSINILLFSGLIWFGASKFNDWIDQLIPDWLSFLSFILWPLFAIALLLVVFYSFTFIGNFISAPFNSLLSEATEEFLRTQKVSVEMNLGHLLRSLPAVLWSEVLKLLHFVKWAIPVLILFMIPGLNLAAPFLWAALSAWMLTIQYTDYALSNHHQLFAQNRALFSQRKGMTLGFGSLVSLITMIPLVNFVAMPVAITGATALCYREGFLRGE